MTDTLTCSKCGTGLPLAPADVPEGGPVVCEDCAQAADICGQSKSGYVCHLRPNHGPKDAPMHAGLTTTEGLVAMWQEGEIGVKIKRWKPPEAAREEHDEPQDIGAEEGGEGPSSDQEGRAPGQD